LRSPERNPVGVVERLLAVQGQDPRGFRLAVRTRTRGTIEADARTRTGDPFITSEVLYQLSYVGGAPGAGAASIVAPLILSSGQN
jgi:hypothetical protein